MAYIGGKKVGEAVRPASFISKTITLSLPGRYFASLDACDGYSQVYVTATDMPSTMRQFVVGDETVTTLILSNDVTNVVGCLQSFPNLNLFVVTNVDGVITFASNTFSGTKIGSGNGRIIVPNSLQAEYEATYPQYIFDSWVFEIEFTIPFIGETTLTPEYIRTVVASTGGDADIVTKVIIPTDFSPDSVLAVLKDTDVIGEEFPNVGGNVYYGNKKMYFDDARTLLALDYIEINNAASGKSMSLGFSLPYTEGKTFTINTKFTIGSEVTANDFNKGRIIGTTSGNRAFSPLMLYTGSYGSTIALGCALANQSDFNPDYDYLTIPNSERNVYYTASASLTYSSTNPSQVFVINGETKTYTTAYSTGYQYLYTYGLKLADGKYGGKVQYIEVLDDGSRTVNLVAAYDKSQELYGLYETIGETFRGNDTYSGGLEEQSA